MSINYYSRHSLTEGQKVLLLKTLTALKHHGHNPENQGLTCIGGIYASEDQLAGQEGDFIPQYELDINWVSSHINFISIPDVAWDTGNYILAGVFPVDMIFEALEYAQKNDINLSVITFKFDRDRQANDGQGQVLNLTKSITYQMIEGKLNSLEVLA